MSGVQRWPRGLGRMSGRLPGTRRTAWPGLRLERWWAAAACLVSFAAVWTAQRAMRVSLLDVMVYRAAGWTVRSGGDLYGLRVMTARLPMTYPPFAGLLFVPLTWVDVGTMRTLATAGNLALTIALAALSLRLAGLPGRPAAVLAVAALAVWCEPVWTTLRYGQINLLLAVLVLWDLTRAPTHRWAGVGIGIAAGIKLTPGLFVVLLGATGLLARGTSYLRHALVAAGTFAATVLVGAVALPHDSRRYWTAAAWAPDRPGPAENLANQSLRGVVARLEHTGAPSSTAWVPLSLMVAAAGLAVGVAALMAGRSLPHGTAWATLACAVTALLVSPVSWSHHWVWAVPMVVLLAGEAVRERDPGRRPTAASRPDPHPPGPRRLTSRRPATSDLDPRNRRCVNPHYPRHVAPSRPQSRRRGPRLLNFRLLNPRRLAPRRLSPSMPDASRPAPGGTDPSGPDPRRLDPRRVATAAAVALVFCSYVIWTLPHGSRRPELRESATEILVAAAYPLTGLFFLSLAGARAARALCGRKSRLARTGDDRSPVRSA